MKFAAAILAESRAPLEVDEIEWTQGLQAGQVLVEMELSGVCGAQINEIEAAKGPDRFLPHLLGHEGLGRVVEIGPLVSTVAVGDTVVLHWMPGSGLQSTPAEYSWRGRRLNAGWVTTLSEYTVISENRCTRIEPTTVSRSFLPLLGCAATTALGVLGNDAGLQVGESVVVLGTGGVGLLTVALARVGGALPVVGVDISQERTQMAEALGADTTLIASTDSAQTEGQILEALGGRAPDVVIDTTGNRGIIEMAYRLVSGGGRCVLVGVPRHDEPISIDSLPLHFNTRMVGSKGGGCKPERDIPRIIRLVEGGRLDVASMTLEQFTLADVNEGITTLKQGRSGRVVIQCGSGSPSVR